MVPELRWYAEPKAGFWQDPPIVQENPVLWNNGVSVFVPQSPPEVGGLGLLVVGAILGCAKNLLLYQGRRCLTWGRHISQNPISSLFLDSGMRVNTFFLRGV